MVVACTNRLRRGWTEENVAEWERDNQQFRDGVLEVITPFLYPARVAIELFAGPGVFYRQLVKIVPRMYGIELNPDLLEYLRQKLTEDRLADGIQDPKYEGILVCAPAHKIADMEIYQGQEPKVVDVILWLRSGLHVPDVEFDELTSGAVSILSLGGTIIVCELFEDDRPSDREIHDGTWYRSLSRYDQAFGRKMRRILTSEPIMNDGDPCRVAVWQVR